jgi:Short C-terminal domain
MAPANSQTNALLDELVAFTRDDRDDLAMRLLEFNALRAEGEITDEEFDERRAALYRM